MDVSPKTLREVEFREKLRGYHPEDVDRFLEEVAGGIEGMQDRLRQAVERAQRAELAAVPAPAPAPSFDTSATDDTLRKTLVLAQRTADLAVQEAREQAARILSSAEQQAQARLADADERARRTHEDALSDIRAELAGLEVTRQRAQQDVDALNRWVDEHRSQLIAALSEALGLMERVGVRTPAPTSRPIDLPPGPRPGSAGQVTGGQVTGAGPGPSGDGGSPALTGLAPGPSGPPGAGGPGGGGPGPARPGGNPVPSMKVVAVESGSDSGPPTVVWHPDDAESPPSAGRSGEVDPTPGHGNPAVEGHDDGAADPQEQALDEFFDDGDDSGYLGERRFGGRLRRRR